jgi:hypothetical protein
VKRNIRDLILSDAKGFIPAKCKKEWLQWRNPADKKGIVVAISKEQEWMLPWWWQNYSNHNSFPVAFADFGMSSTAKKWCKKRGQLLSMPKWPKSYVANKKQIPLQVLEKWKKHFKSICILDSRHYWFQKPFAMIKTPFEKTVWLDLDCQVMKPLDPLFDYLQDHEFGCVKEAMVTQARRYYSGLIEMGEFLYNSGVIIYRQHASILPKWAKASLSHNHLFWGDQELLSNLIFQNNEQVCELPNTFNWFYNWKVNPEAVILHYITLKGKEKIKEQMEKLSKLSFFKNDWSLQK